MGAAIVLPTGMLFALRIAHSTNVFSQLVSSDESGKKRTRSAAIIT
jgi:hypothetical protein